MYLYVQPTGTRSWIQRLVIRGRKRELGLGSVALVSLAEAREQALANRKLARSGGDPLAEKRRSVGIPTFAEAARRVVEQKPDGAGIDGTAGRPAGIRVPGADGGAVGRGTVGRVDRDRSGERRVDRTG